MPTVTAAATVPCGATALNNLLSFWLKSKDIPRFLIYVNYCGAPEISGIACNPMQIPENRQIRPLVTTSSTSLTFNYFLTFSLNFYDILL
ncbi:MAG: hypothetical protein ACAH83_17095 [Alphaproteobacteria bacterium]